MPAKESKGLLPTVTHLWLDNPVTRTWAGWQKALWENNPLARLVPIDAEEIWRAFVAVSSDLVAHPTAWPERGGALLRGYADLWLWALGRGVGRKEVDKAGGPGRADRRFQDKAWSDNFAYDLLRRWYLMLGDWMLATAAEAQGLDPREKQRAAFYIRQFVDMLSPSNFILTNPEVLRETINTGGANLRDGLRNLLDDIQRGEIKVAGKEQFKIGVNLALTPGQVILRNELIELIQYAPATESVYSVPILIVPPWINKFYVMDMRPGKSMVEYLVAQGYTVFLISWRNPDASLESVNMEDYLRLGPLAAARAVRAITGSPRLHLVGYCLGGTLLAITLAYLAAKGAEASAAGAPGVTRAKRAGGAKSVPRAPGGDVATGAWPEAASGTFFASLQDFREVGETGIFISEEWISEIEKRTAKRGYLDAVEMGSIFRLMRSNDLIWSFYVNNYLLGREPIAFDLMYWSVDGTRMPRTMHLYYLRNMYLENNLVAPGRLSMLGMPIDLGKVSCPAYVVAGTEDHIVPWRSAHRARSLFGGPSRLILASGGHIVAIINPPPGKGFYYTNESASPYPDQWLKAARRIDGSWWPDWMAWLAPLSGERRPPPPMGSEECPPLGKAPGTYVLAD